MTELKHTEIRLTDWASFKLETLLCPSCEEGNLHQVCYTIFERKGGEDGEVIAIEISDLTSKISFHNAYNSRNPSTRRQGLAVLFACEHCNVVGELVIYQHKGSTYMKWRPATPEQCKEYAIFEIDDA